MQTISTQPSSIPISNSTTISHPWLMLISRSTLFIFFQGSIALFFAVTASAPLRVKPMVDSVFRVDSSL